MVESYISICARLDGFPETLNYLLNKFRILKQVGNKNSCWKGGRCVDTHGYIQIYTPEHPHKVHNYVPEHRLVMEQYLKRILEPKEIIHHINHIRSDNRIENLELMSQSEHVKLHKFDLHGDMSNRKCCQCTSDTTYSDPTPHWYHVNNKIVCKRCYISIQRRKKRGLVP